MATLVTHADTTTEVFNRTHDALLGNDIYAGMDALDATRHARARG